MQKQAIISALKLPKLIAHRGAALYAPENTLASLKKAAEIGAEWVEFDVMLTKHHEPIVFHDARLDRTTNGRGFVRNSDYSVISGLDAGNWFAKDFAGERVPTLSEWLNTTASLNLGLNLEMKATRWNARMLAQTVAIELAQNLPRSHAAPLISSSSRYCLKAMRERGAHYLLGYITDSWRKNWQSILAESDCISLHINHNVLTEKRIREVKEKNYLLLAYTVNDRKRAEELFAMGVDSIFSDDPQLLK